MIAANANFAFVSPSHATLREIERYVDLSKWRREVISNPNGFLTKPRQVSRRVKPQLLFIGRVEASKGVEMMLRSVRSAHELVDFDVDILGTGDLEPSLRQEYAHLPWVRFHGSVSQESISDFMSRASVLLVPSLWLETVPGVAVHALFAGLPVLGSRIGGIPEHVSDGRTGRLLPPGDEKAWSAEIVRISQDEQQVSIWSAACLDEARRFDPALALDRYDRLIREMVATQPTDATKRHALA